MEGECDWKGEMMQLDTKKLVVIHSHTLVCDGATERLLLLEILKLVDLIRGLFVGMDSAITRLANDRKKSNHSIELLTSLMPRQLFL